MNFRRTLSASVLVALALGGLTACQSKFGLAATVDGQRLTDSTLSGYVQAGAKPYTDQTSGTSITPKIFALETWLDVRVIESTIADTSGGPASDQELSQADSAVLGSSSRTQLLSYYENLGYTSKLAELVLERYAAFVVLAERVGKTDAPHALSLLNSQAGAQKVIEQVQQHESDVQVSPRYGTWDSTNLELSSDAGSGTPNFVSFPGKNKQSGQTETTP